MAALWSVSQPILICTCSRRVSNKIRAGISRQAQVKSWDKTFFFFFFFLLVSVFILIWSGGMNGDEVFPITHSVSKKKTDLKVKDTAIFKVFLCVCVMTGVL